jgi:hypothetical protein
VVLILVLFNKKPVVALTVPVKERLPAVPLSVREKRVLLSPSLIVKVPLLPAVARVIDGVLLLKINGELELKVLVLVKVLA